MSLHTGKGNPPLSFASSLTPLSSDGKTRDNMLNGNLTTPLNNSQISQKFDPLNIKNPHNSNNKSVQSKKNAPLSILSTQSINALSGVFVYRSLRELDKAIIHLKKKKSESLKIIAEEEEKITILNNRREAIMKLMNPLLSNIEQKKNELQSLNALHNDRESEMRSIVNATLIHMKETKRNLNCFYKNRLNEELALQRGYYMKNSKKSTLLNAGNQKEIIRKAQNNAISRSRDPPIAVLLEGN